VIQKKRMLAGELYIFEDPELYKDRDKNRTILHELNQTSHLQLERREALFKDLFGSIGENFKIQTPFYCDYGNNIYIGDNFFANFDCLILDIAEVHIGNNVMFAPRVNIFTAGHPIDAEVRNTKLEFGTPVTIGDNVWVGGNVTINPGVTIGDNVVIGSGSVVTRNIPSNTVAVGNPCRVIRDITEADKIYWKEKQAQFHRDMEKLK
jgi:maltose O-acetyltransferase